MGRNRAAAFGSGGADWTHGRGVLADKSSVSMNLPCLFDVSQQADPGGFPARLACSPRGTNPVRARISFQARYSARFWASGATRQTPTALLRKLGSDCGMGFCNFSGLAMSNKKS